MSTHVLLNLLSELRKRDKMRGFLSILSLFRNSFNKFNNIGARKLDSIYHITLKLPKDHIFSENVKILPFFTQSYNGPHYVMLLNLFTTSGLLILLHGIILLPDAMSFDNSC